MQLNEKRCKKRAGVVGIVLRSYTGDKDNVEAFLEEHIAPIAECVRIKIVIFLMTSNS